MPFVVSIVDKSADLIDIVGHYDTLSRPLRLSKNTALSMPEILRAVYMRVAPFRDRKVGLVHFCRPIGPRSWVGG